MVASAEAEATAAGNRAFARWLLGEIRASDRVAALDGSCEAYRFGAVAPGSRGLLVPWEAFEADPVGVVNQALVDGRRRIAPVVLAEYLGDEDAVRLRWGRLVPGERAVPGAVRLD